MFCKFESMLQNGDANKGSKAYRNDWGFSVPKFYFKTVIINRVSMFENITLQALNEILWLHLRTVVYF